jgi:hypothetical protein
LSATGTAAAAAEAWKNGENVGDPASFLGRNSPLFSALNDVYSPLAFNTYIFCGPVSSGFLGRLFSPKSVEKVFNFVPL